MADYTVKRVDEMEASFLGTFKRVRAELGVMSFGVQVIDLPPNLEQYPTHDHADSGQEEVFLLLRGNGDLEVDGERIPLDDETFVRVGPEAQRKVWPGDQGMRILALGGAPGKVYEPPEVTQLGAPDPMAQPQT
jgi:hypothetical protein